MRRNSEKSLAWKLLKHDISVSQSACFLIANTLGLAIILLSCVCYDTMTNALRGLDAGERGHESRFVVLSRQGTSVSSIFGSNKFSTQDVQLLKEYPGVVDVAEFMTAESPISAEINLLSGMRGNFHSQIFLESVPDKFLDSIPEGWGYEPGDVAVPLMMPESYMAIYNYGFAPSHGLPQLNFSTLSLLPVKLTAHTMHGVVQIDAKIVGLTKRYDTLLAPQPFIEYLNGSDNVGKDHASRLVVEVNDDAMQKFCDYARSEGYDVSDDAIVAAKANGIVNVVVSIAMTVGFLIVALAFAFLVLSIFLLIRRSEHNIKGLSVLGYDKILIWNYYAKCIVDINGGSLIIAVAIDLLLDYFYLTPMLKSIGISIALGIMPLIVVMAINAVVVICSLILIYRRLSKIYSFRRK